ANVEPYSLHCSVQLPHLHSFPTRRSSDLPDRVPPLLGIHLKRNALAECVVLKLERIVPAESPRRRFVVRLRIGVLKTVRPDHRRSEEHTSELQSLRHLVCRLLLEQKKEQF